jgi:hypothetical protein
MCFKDTNLNNAVTLNGKARLRATSGGNVLPGFFMPVSGIVDLPTLSNVIPQAHAPSNTPTLWVSCHHCWRGHF